MSIIGSLSVRIGANTADLERGMARARGEVDNFRKSIMPTIKAVAAVGAAATAAAGAVLALTDRAAANARELRAQANQANTSTQQLQRMAYATNTVGINQDKLADILKDVNDRVGDFMQTGAGPMADFFENIAPKVGVTAQEFRNLSGPQALQLYVKTLQQAGVSQQEMTFYMEAMASDSTRLAPLLQNNAKLLNEMAAEADQLGIVLSDVQIESLMRAGAEMDRLRGLISGIGNVIAGEVAPYVTALIGAFNDAAIEAGGWGNIVRDAIRGAAEAVAFLLDKYQEWQILNQRVVVATKDMEFAFAAFAQKSWGSMEWFLNTASAGINNLIKGLRSLPGMGDLELIPSFSESEFLERINNRMEEALGSRNLAQMDLNELLNAEEASESVRKAFDTIEERRKHLLDSLSDQPDGGGGLPNGLFGGGGEGPAGAGGGQGGDTEDPGAEMRERMTARLETLRQGLMTEKEVERENFQQRIEELAELREAELIGRMEHFELLEQAQREHAERITSIDQKEAQQRVINQERAEKLIRDMRQQTTQLAIGLLDEFAGKSKAAALASIALNKALSIAQAIQNTSVAFTKALTIDPTGSLAARVATMGAVQVGIIGATGLAEAAGVFSGGGASGGSVSAGGGGASSGGSAPAQQPQQQAPAGGTLTVQGISASSIFSGDAVRELAEELIDYQKRGGQVVIA